MATFPRPMSSDPSAKTAAGRLRLRLENDGEWWKLFDSNSSRDEIEHELVSLGIFQSPRSHRDFIENNSLSAIVRELWRNRKNQTLSTPPQIEQGFARLKNVLYGRDRLRRALTFAIALTPLCAMSPSKLKIALGEKIDMGVLCGHNDETRMAWAWFKSLLSTFVAFVWPGVASTASFSAGNRDSYEVNEILERTSISKTRGKWKVVDDGRTVDGDWVRASFEGRYRPNLTRCWWRSADVEGVRESTLDEAIAARITGACREDGVSGAWLKGWPDMVLSAKDLSWFRISTDPWERIDRADIPVTSGTADLFEMPRAFDPSTLPLPFVHDITRIPFETVRGFSCVEKQRHLFL